MDSITSSIKFLEDEDSSIGSDNPCLIDQQELRKEELRKEQSKQKMNFINQCYSDLNNLKQPSSRTSTPISQISLSKLFLFVNWFERNVIVSCKFFVP